MSSEPVERRLTAILAADVAGYSRLIGADEEGTLAQLKAFRKTLVDPTIAKHRGRIVKTTGDGMLVEFASAELPALTATARCPSRVKLRNTQHEQMSSALPPCVDGSELARTFFTFAALVGAPMCSAF